MGRRFQYKNPTFYAMLVADAISIALALWLSYAERFDFFKSEDFKPEFADQIVPSILVFIPLKLLFFYLFGLYRGMWRYTNLRDMRKIIGAVVSSSLVIVSFIAYKHQFQGFSRGLYLLDAFFTFAFIAGLRVMVREIFALRSHGKIVNPFKWSSDARRVPPTKVILIGAGNSGERLVRELSEDGNLYEIVCFLDDDKKKKHRSLHGITVFGSADQLSEAVEKYRATLVLISIANLNGAEMRRIIDICEQVGISYKRMPTAERIADGSVSLKELRDVDYEDLLGRPPVKLEHPAVSEYLRDKIVLVTGAGGSIGSELVRQIIKFDPAKLVLVDAGEENLFNIQMELKNKFGFERIVPIIARVQDEGIMREIFAKYQPYTVFHAAAYKHVPLMEINPWQAIENNVLGSYTIMKCASEFGVKRFVLVSTDKAVRPTNVMGATKRVTELVMHAISKESETVFMAVRFGNVLGSSGSVVPLFRRQIERGGPVTVTHSEITRYFMTIPEASRLILQAGTLGKGGDIFILHMGTPVKIVDMARDLIRLSGKEPDIDIKIEFTGMRPGEKLYEELITEGEGIVPTTHKKIMVLKPENGIDLDWIEERMKELRELVSAHDAVAIKRCLHKMVPEYDFQQSDAVL